MGKSEKAAHALADAVLDCVPTTWLDPMFTGPKAVVGEPPYNCKDIEAVCRAIRARLLNVHVKCTSGDKR